MSDDLVNIAAHLPARALAQPHTLAIIEPRGARYRHLTFRELDAETDRLAAGLVRAGIGRGVRTVLMVPPSLAFYTLTFALFKVGAVVVLIDPGMGLKSLGVCLKEAAPEAFIGVSKAHLARLLFGWARETVRLSITVGRRFGWRGLTLDDVRRLGRKRGFKAAATTAGETAAILFTSGSTGVAKGVVYTHGIFAAQVEALRTLYDIRPGEVDLPTFPLFGLFGPALGMTAVIPEMDATRPAHVDPRKIFAAIERFGVTNLFGSPALLRRISGYAAANGVKTPTLRRVLSAGAPVSPAVIERTAGMLSAGVQVHTPYGATEALPIATIGSDEILGETGPRTWEGAGVCVGRAAPGVEMRIIRISDEVVAEWRAELEVGVGEVGEIVVRGPVVTRSYFNRPRATALAKIADGAGFWHRMGDLGYVDGQGRLWFCGRKSQRVGELFTIPVEGVFNAHEAVARTALVGVERRGKVEAVLCVEREAGARISDEELRRELLVLGGRYGHTAGVTTILFHPAFPVDVRHNAKIFRERLAVWAAGRLGGSRE